MGMSGRKSVCRFGFMLILLAVGILFGNNQAHSESMFPNGLIFEDAFKPGFGASVGKVGLVQGDVFIIHENTLVAYPAESDLPLFEGDTLITRKKGRVRFSLNDGSILTLASQTKLVINLSVYDPTKKSRFSFLGMDLGKVRFWVKKLVDFKNSEFKVKTKTAVVGVRGSDFIIIASANRTEVTALEKTELEVVSLAGPENPSEIADFERIVIEQGALPSSAEDIFSEEIENMKRDFTITPKGIEAEAQAEVREIKAKMPAFKGPVGQEPLKLAIEGKGILVPREELIRPENMGEMEDRKPEPPRPPDVVKREEMSGRAETVLEKQEEIHRDHQEKVMDKKIRKELPPFPGKPE